MTLRAAVQMDPMDDINIGGDSSFHLILKALERGYELYHYDVRGLTWEAGRLTTKAHRIVEAQRADVVQEHPHGATVPRPRPGHEPRPRAGQEARECAASCMRLRAQPIRQCSAAWPSAVA